MHRLKMFGVYVNMCIDPGKPPHDDGLATAIEQLQGRDTLIWLVVQGGKPSSDAADDRAVAMIGRIADMAGKAGLRVAIYPHVGCYVARVEDAVRLVKKIDRPNVGASFNLCHFLATDSETQERRYSMNHVQFNRRRLLKGAAVAAAAPYMITSTALGNADTPPASERITLGHIGMGGPDSTKFIGPDGWVWICGGIDAHPKSLLTSTIGPRDVDLVDSPNHCQSFLDGIKSRKPPVSPLDQAVRSDLISHLSNIAIRTGRKITWDTKKMTIVGDDEAAKLMHRDMRAPWTL